MAGLHDEVLYGAVENGTVRATDREKKGSNKIMKNLTRKGQDHKK